MPRFPQPPPFIRNFAKTSARTCVDPALLTSAGYHGAKFISRNYIEHVSHAVDLSQPVKALLDFVPPPLPTVPPLLPELPHLSLGHLPVALQHAAAYVANVAGGLAHVVSDLNACILPVTIALPILRFINWLLHSSNLSSSVHDIIKNTEVLRFLIAETNLSEEYVKRSALNDPTVPSNAKPTDLPAHLAQISACSTEVAMLRGTADNLHTYLGNQLLNMQRDLDNRVMIKIASNVPRDFPAKMDRFCSEFAYQRHSFTQPHAECAVARKVSVLMAISAMNKREKNVVAVAASDHQVAMIPDLVHNHAPELSGRDWYRYSEAYSQNLRTHAAGFNCKCSLQTCPHVFPGSQLFLPLSAHDIHIRDVIRSMISNKQRTATVIMHLPVPFLDRRINNWTDAELGVRFERRNGKIIMYHLQEATAGYHNNAEAMMSWARPPPSVPGYNITVEEERSIGSLYTLTLKVSPGSQEAYSYMHRVSGGRFYLLPVLKPDWMFRPEEDRHFVVPATRFENVVKFAEISGQQKNAFEIIANKVRGQEAEIKVANQTVLPRWELSLEEFNSVVVHAMVASNLYSRCSDASLRTGLSYVSDWFGRMDSSLPRRYGNYLVDLVTFRGARSARQMFSRSTGNRIMDNIFAIYMREGKFDNPYEVHGKFRLQVDETRGFLDSLDETEIPIGFTCVKPNRLVTPPQPEKLWLDEIDLTDDYFVTRRTRENRLETFHAERAAICTLLAALGDAPPQRRNRKQRKSTRNAPKESTEAVAVEATLPLIASQPTTDVTSPPTLSLTKERPRSIRQPPASVQSRASLASLPATDRTTPSLDDKSSAVSTEPPSSVGEIPCTAMTDTVLDDLRNADLSCPVYRVRLDPDTISALTISTKISFDAPLDFVEYFDSSPSHREFTQTFQSKGDVVRELDITSRIPCPDRGLIELMRLVLDNNRRTSGEIDFNVEEYLDSEIERARPDLTALYEEEETGGLADIIRTFKRTVARCDNPYLRPQLILDGIPGSAKSTAIRKLTLGERTVVVVPTGDLKRDWESHVDPAKVSVVTMHKVPSTMNSIKYLIFDECNRFDARLLQLWGCIAARNRVRHVICIGDTYQSKRLSQDSSVIGQHYLRAPTILMTNSFTMPVDSLVAFLAANGLSHDNYRTTSKTVRSIAFLDRSPDPAQFRRFDLLTRARVTADEIKDASGEVIPSVTQSQGVRAQQHYFCTGLTAKQARWVAKMEQIQSVLFTRHTGSLIIDMPVGEAGTAFPNVPLESWNFINGNSISRKEQIRQFTPGYLDYLPTQVSNKDTAVYSAALPLEVSFQHEEKLMPINKRVDEEVYHEAAPIEVFPVKHLTAELIMEKSRFGSRRDYKESLDFYAQAAHGLLACGELGWGDEPKMRSHLEGSSALGDIQMARDRYNDLRNLCLRQLNEPKRMFATAQDICDAKDMYQRYIQAFVAEEYTSTMFQSTSYDYLVNRTETFLAAWNDPFGFAAKSFTRNAFLKTQVKIKPGLNGQETHGQQVIANEPEFTNAFFDLCRQVLKGFRETDRADFITDAGYSDKDLEKLMQFTGISQRIEAGKNLQIDLSRQDSTHRIAHVYALAMFMLSLGCDEGKVMAYVSLRSMAYVKSLAANLYKAIIKWNLGSGDPLTLPANCFMMKCCIAVRYDNIRNCAALQKGDDFTASNDGYRLSPLGALFARLDVTMKIDEDLPAYHAGRYLYRGRLLADPVRAFYRHYSRTHDPAVSIAELHQSFCDRNVDYNEEERRYLIEILPVHYSDVTPEQAITIVEGVSSLRSFKYFRSTYKCQTHPELNIYNPDTDCAFNVARFLLPHLPKLAHKQFRYQESQVSLVKLFSRYGVPAIAVNHPGLVPRGFFGAVVLPEHCYAKVAAAPHY